MLAAMRCPTGFFSLSAHYCTTFFMSLIEQFTSSAVIQATEAKRMEAKRDIDVMRPN